MAEIIGAALGLIGKAVASPAKDAAFRRPKIVSVLKKLGLDPKQPPRDVYSLYAYALVECLYGKDESVLNLFSDEYVQESFFRSFSDDNWSRLSVELSEAVHRNRETREFGYLPHSIEEETREFVAKFQDLVSRSRLAYEIRVEHKLDGMSVMLDQVLKTRHQEERHRQAEDPERATSSPAERLFDDVRIWFEAVGYRIRRQWSIQQLGVALSVEVPQRRRGRFDLVIALCVDGELAPYHLQALQELVEENEASEGWGIAQLRVSKAARVQVEQSGGGLYCYSFDELIDLEADFEPYITWLEGEVRSRHIDTRFVPLSCRKDEVDPRTEKTYEASSYDWRDGGLDNYVDAWLSDPAKKHLSLLGEFGMGKSWFALHLAGRLAAGWKDAKKRGVARPRIPLVVPLRDYAKQTSVSALLSEFFFHKHQIEIRNYEVFNVLNKMGRFLLIFDGFDEMASRTDRNTMVGNFWELAKVVEPGAKVLLSSRTEYFPEAKEARDLFDARVSASTTAMPADGPTFEIVELVPFDDEQIRMMLRHLLVPEKLEVVMEHEGVRDLMRRPVMSELVIDALPEIEQGAVINLARIYLYAIKRKMDRDVSSERTFTSRADKLFFLCEVAWEMIRTNQLSLNYKDFPAKLRACFGSVVENSQDLDFWEQDMRNQSMLVRNSRGDYGPSHKSLLEFLIAFRFAAELGLLEGDFLKLIPGAEKDNGKRYSWSEYFTLRSDNGEFPGISDFRSEDVDRLAENFGSAEYNPVVFDFLAAMVKESSSCKDVLLKHIKATAHAQNPKALGGNCAHLLVQAGGDLEGADLGGTNLRGLGKTGDIFIDVSLTNANLANADLSETNLAYYRKGGANFREAALADSGFLVSRVQIRQIEVHGSGAITALRVNSTSARPWGVGDSAVLHWSSGNILDRPKIFPIDSYTSPWLGGVRIFLWGEEAWGCADSSGGVVVRSTRTGDVIRRLPEGTLGAVDWAGRDAVMVAAGREEYKFGWRVIDPASGAVLAEFDETPSHEGGVRMWATTLTPTGAAVWAAAEHETWRSEISAETAGLQQTSHIPVGTSHALAAGGHLGLMVDEENVYIHDAEFKPIVYAKQDIGNALEELTDASYIVMAADKRRVVGASKSKISVWETVGAWHEVWSHQLSAPPTEMPVLSIDESVVLCALRSGELLSWSLDSGERTGGITVNPHLQGANFSKWAEMESWVRESILLAGGNIEDDQ
ncbi:NACHT domain-containing protein [Streptomyces sp. NPDC047525]|uniref:NACHT domain-containing protein n=1 Tax=Streptomyces sp. NPDC047525 TaxID=3155264 RepID=UPI00340F8C31